MQSFSPSGPETETTRSTRVWSWGEKLCPVSLGDIVLEIDASRVKNGRDRKWIQTQRERPWANYGPEWSQNRCDPRVGLGPTGMGLGLSHGHCFYKVLALLPVSHSCHCAKGNPDTLALVPRVLHSGDEPHLALEVLGVSSWSLTATHAQPCLLTQPWFLQKYSTQFIGIFGNFSLRYMLRSVMILASMKLYTVIKVWKKKSGGKLKKGGMEGDRKEGGEGSVEGGRGIGRERMIVRLWVASGLMSLFHVRWSKQQRFSLLLMIYLGQEGLL